MKEFRALFLIAMVYSLHSCSSSKLAESNLTKDPEMEIGNDAGKNFQNYVHSIREGSTPAGTSKSSGGCGCN